LLGAGSTCHFSQDRSHLRERIRRIPAYLPEGLPGAGRKICEKYIWRKIIGEITIEFIEAAVERMFSADEVTSVVDPARLKRLKQQIVSLFLKL
jgi:hypothetical protein